MRDKNILTNEQYERSLSFQKENEKLINDNT